jgi:hypothetical protein
MAVEMRMRVPTGPWIMSMIVRVRVERRLRVGGSVSTLGRASVSSMWTSRVRSMWEGFAM